MTALAYRYHRFSTASQDKGSSIERQDEITMEMVRSNGWSLAPGGAIEDRGRSAWKGDHLKVGGLGRFKARIDSGEIEPGSILVIENLDRLSRENVRKARRWIEEVTEAGVRVAVGNLNKVFDEASLSGENIVDLIQYLFEAQRANAESQRKSDMRKKVNAKQIEKAQRGEIYSPRGPAWLIDVNGKWEPCPIRAAVVVQIYEWSASGLGYSAICQRLNRDVSAWTKGWKTEKAEWKIGYVRDILTSPMVEGEYHRKAVGEDRDEIILGYYPRVVPADLVERARNARKARTGTGGQRAEEARNLFAGRTACLECGGAMEKIVNHNGKGKKYYYFLCRGARSGACANRTQYRYDLFEAAALEQMLHLSLDDTHFTKVEETAPLITRIAELRKEREQVQAKVNNLVDQIESGSGSATLGGRLDAREAELAAIDHSLAEAEGELELARGKVSPEAHLKRVMEVRSAMDGDDLEASQQARRLVRTAIQNVVERIEFSKLWVSDGGKKNRMIKMVLVGNHVTFTFDGHGALISKRDDRPAYVGDPDSRYSQILLDSDEAKQREERGAIDAQIARGNKATA